MDKLKSWLSDVYAHITLEPAVALYLISVGLNEVIRPNLLLSKACTQKLNYTDCGNLTGEHLVAVQRTVSEYERTLSLMAFAPRIIYALLAGAWTDRNGRKFAIAAPIFGHFLANLTFLANYHFDSLPFETLYMEFVSEMCGSFILYYLAVYSYMADVTEEKFRTSRIGVIDGTDYICTMVGTALSGPAFKHLGYSAVFSASAVMALASVFYVIVFVKESVTVVSTADTMPKPADLVSGFVTVLKPREGSRRLMVLLLVANFACYIFAYNGTEGSHRYLFAAKQYGWDEQQFTLYLSFYRVCYLVTLWLLLPMASKWLGLHDGTVAVIACLTGALGQSVPVLLPSTTAWALYLGGAVASLSPAATITARAMASRCVEAKEVGKVFAVISLMSAISSSLVTAAFQELYSNTLETFPGAFWLVNAACLLITVPSNLFVRSRLTYTQQEDGSSKI